MADMLTSAPRLQGPRGRPGRPRAYDDSAVDYARGRPGMSSPREFRDRGRGGGGHPSGSWGQHQEGFGRGGPRGFPANGISPRPPGGAAGDLRTRLLDARVQSEGEARLRRQPRPSDLDFVLDLNLDQEELRRAKQIVSSDQFEFLFCMRLVMSPAEIVVRRRRRR
eukprot:tig00021518_g22027.t1